MLQTIFILTFSAVMLWVLSCDESTYLLNVNVNVFNLMCDGSVALNVNTMCVTCVDIHAQ